ncbi:MAG: tRNA (N6-threonylcarbamoyladenosine(37)-N6)-methyltransferase TrmO [Gammaproteobacteria bacterium]|nr:tRNA (N6-threonylcarbamoyladenosine(37)-N6)-methyltransferase TrmO [Gammaproteobacteria bacterium]
MDAHRHAITLQPIGYVHSCFREKFGIPRQPGLVPHARARIEILAPYNRAEAFRGIEDFSHLWIGFLFHRHLGAAWRATVRPPRLGGNERVGVFATRSTYRPNPLGLSVVRLDHVEIAGDAVSLHVSGIDLLDGTPVVDIKPYLPYADALPEARGGFAPTPPDRTLGIVFTETADRQIAAREAAGLPDLRALITELLQLDPRPAYRGGETGAADYGMRLYDFDLRWRVEGKTVTVTALVDCDED